MSKKSIVRRRASVAPAVETLESRQLLSAVVDVRLTGGGQNATVTTVGTHDVLFCRVVALQTGPTENLIYLGRAYHSVRARRS